MIPEAAVWAIFFIPLCSFVVIGFIIRPFFNRYRYLSSVVLISGLVACLILSIWTLRSVIDNAGALGSALGFAPHLWLSVGGIDISMGLMVDQLTAIMLIVVVLVSLMVQVYSHGYMREDPGYARYYAFMSLFTASMIGLVLASNIIQLYVFWELVGLSSYLLIGFWHHRPAAAAAAKKAFIVTRLGDLGFLIAILFLFFNSENYSALGLSFLEIGDIQKGAALGVLGGLSATGLAIGIFCGAVGKSAQFPLHVWLPDAMEGPTPVSALIHAATMVAAGVFLIARFFPVFEASTDALTTVAMIGAFTALLAATMALATNDIKRVLAYSTISQLGYMVAALGLGAYGIALFHLFNHAFFKALLFLGAGSVNHATGTFDMRYMGGLRQVMPITYIATLLGALSLIGIFPLAGFWSKDEVLRHAWSGAGAVDSIAFYMLAVAVFLTAVYTTRMIWMTFHGSFKGGVEREHADAGEAVPAESHGVHLAESPLVMVGPMALLAVGAVVSGYLANPEKAFLGIDAHWFVGFLMPLGAHGEAAGGVDVALAAVVMGIAVVGMALALFLQRGRDVLLPSVLSRPLEGGRALLVRKYYMDDLYEGLAVRRIFYGCIAAMAHWFDRSVVDGAAEGVGLFSRNIGRAVGLLQTGQVQGYGVAITVGILAILLGYLVWG